MRRLSGANRTRVNGPCLKGTVQTRAMPTERMWRSIFIKAMMMNKPCLSGFYPHPQHVGCCQAPE
jgi:hypothetical protein